MFLEYVQDSGYDLPMVFNRVGVYQDIVHTDHLVLGKFGLVRSQAIFAGPETGQSCP